MLFWPEGLLSEEKVCMSVCLCVGLCVCDWPYPAQSHFINSNSPMDAIL